MTQIAKSIWRRDRDEAIRLDRQHPALATAVPGNAPGFVNGDGTGDMALIYLAKGDAAAARQRLGKFPALLKADLERQPGNTRVIHELKVMPVYFNLRGDARYEALLHDPKNNAPLF